jgi:RNA recognition motif-containing protein
VEDKKNKLFIGGLAYAATEEDLRPVFEAFGPVAEVAVIMDKMSNRPKGFAFVTMEKEEDAAAAIEKFKPVEEGGEGGPSVAGRTISVTLARPKSADDRPRSGGGNRFGDRGGNNFRNGGNRGGYGNRY